MKLTDEILILTHRIAAILALWVAVSAPPVFAQDEQAGAVALDELRVFARVFEQIRQTYVEDIDDAELFDMAISGMLLQLDPHSEYLTEERMEELEETATGSFQGIGVELSMEDGDLMIVAPLDDSPAAEAGLQSGDIIVRINDEPIQGLSMADSLQLLDGEIGDEVKLSIWRESTGDTEDFALVRARIPLDSVSHRVIGGDVGYVRINRFQQRTGEEFLEAVQSLEEQADYLNGVIIDLRNNPGGLLQASVEVVSTLIDGGLVVSTRGRYPAFNTEHRAEPGERLAELPIVVLINRGSASAAEIVAGALQDHDRAVIVGDISFGKGSVQNVIGIDEERAIKLTTARYYTPSGRSIQAQGIVPDIIIEEGSVTWRPALTAVTEASLLRHLENDQADSDEPELLGMVEGISDIEDVQLAHAVSLLKGTHILHRGAGALMSN
jgi:carboxyl-terminal processing protease